jgi:hypothetical protein
VGTLTAFPFLKDPALDLDNNGVGKNINGSFYRLAKETQRIPTVSAARVTDLFQEVFKKLPSSTLPTTPYERWTNPLLASTKMNMGIGSQIWLVDTGSMFAMILHSASAHGFFRWKVARNFWEWFYVAKNVTKNQNRLPKRPRNNQFAFPQKTYPILRDKLTTSNPFRIMDYATWLHPHAAHHPDG